VSIVVIVIFCLIAACLIFGLTFHDEILTEKHRKRRAAQSLRVIQGGKRFVVKPHRHG